MKIIPTRTTADLNWYVANVFMRSEIGDDREISLYNNIQLLVCAKSVQEAETKTLEYCKSQEYSYTAIAKNRVYVMFDSIVEIEDCADWILDGRVIEVHSQFYKPSAYKSMNEPFDD